MPRGPVRRAQLIAPFGVGAMLTARDGSSLICAGLDHWYEYEDGSTPDEVTEFKIDEWRLQRRLGVNHFRLPPDYRRPMRGQDIPNARMTVPFLRFPLRHFCPKCRTLSERGLTEIGTILCDACPENARPRLFQVPFVAVCDHGHLQDFPWREWVHRSAEPPCQKRLKLVPSGSESLASQRVSCECGEWRTLASITQAQPDGTATFLSSNLDDSDHDYSCRGRRPWLGTMDDSECARPLKGSLRNAANVYYAHAPSSIYLPRPGSDVPDRLVSLLMRPPHSTTLEQAGAMTTAEHVRAFTPVLVDMYTDDQISRAIKVVLDEPQEEQPDEDRDSSEVDEEAQARSDEFDLLREAGSSDHLEIRTVDMAEYGGALSEHFGRVTLVEKLVETRVLAGFSRVFPENDLTVQDMKNALRRVDPGYGRGWLPAYRAAGEGIFIELREDRLASWLENEAVQTRVRKLDRSYRRVQKLRGLKELKVTPRLVLVHTLAHLLINQLVFDTGYSSASLRERLYVSDAEEKPMAALLLYTAAGDSEGTLGGLVRIGQPGRLESVIRRAISGSRWCAADPICSELGDRSGQGPDSCNLAACHNCALLSETSCEQFNRFLDRALIGGTEDNLDLGFFATDA